ncbi:hypothetical protein [Rheinheimera baltica]|uniref:hypothetical protein n=1 Tax=Rheinheimera baltica TaxID=67576 RepID=UPI0012ECA21A|nr:hypothetical protein [Rheinheimera baltica]MDP5143376.1 hypothetical protein [Rheinheimera baltica]MDP5151213.1 hypothetical protein [Rheinheimera baltica]MDP5191314.1 hypothetical protein [Rheinheimera baltica]
MSVRIGICLITAMVFSSALYAKPAVDFSAEQNKPCWKMIEQKTVGHCKLHFERLEKTELKFAPRDEISRAYSRYFSARTEFPTSYQQIEYALQFFNFSIDKYPVRDSLNYIRSGDGSTQLSMTILTSKTGGYSFVLADNDAHFRQITDALQFPKRKVATHYYRNITKLFAE